MRRSLIVALVIALAIPVSTSTPAYAANPTLNFYISPPTVQNTFVSGARVATFDNKPTGPCPTEWRTDPLDPNDPNDSGTLIGTITTDGCNIAGPSKFGGAVANATAAQYAATTTPAAGTNFVSIPSRKSVTLALDGEKSYLGFWWSAGDPNNKITLFSGGPSGTRVGVFTTATLKNLLGSNTSTDLVAAIDGNSYQGCRYYGNPRLVDRTQNCDGTSSTYNYSQPYAYIHLVGEGGLQFDTIVFTQGSSGGFEFDNMAIALGVTAPSQVTVLPPEIDAGTPNQVATSCEPFTSSFAITTSNFSESPTYTISPATLPAGLTLNPTTGAVSGTATTTSPQTTYTLTATSGQQSASTDITLEITGPTSCSPPPPPNPPTPVVWEPGTTTITVPTLPATIELPPPPNPPGGGSYTFTTHGDSTSLCTIDRDTPTVTVPQPGTCIVTANVGATKNFSKASVTVAFTITSGPMLAATGAPAWPLWAGVVSILGGALLAWTTVARRHSA